MNIEETIRAIQSELGLDVDGKAGPDTWTAIYQRIAPEKAAAQAAAPSAPGETVDPRSEKVIATLQSPVQPYARALVLKAAAHGILIKVLSGLRTYEEQDTLYAQGRTQSGKVVTNARGGYSNHNFGVAFDIGVWDSGKYVDESSKYKAVGVLGAEIGLDWGGNWKTIQDEPHFQLRPAWAADQSEKVMLAELRSRKTSGEGFYA